MCFFLEYVVKNKIYVKTRKHSSRMRIAHLPTVRALVATKCQYRIGGSSSEPVWKGPQWWPPDATSRGWGWGWEIPCLMSKELGAWAGVWGPVQWGPMHHGYWSYAPSCRQTDWSTNKHVWKHYLPATLLSGGKSNFDVCVPNITFLILFSQITLTSETPVKFLIFIFWTIINSSS